MKGRLEEHYFWLIEFLEKNKRYGKKWLGQLSGKNKWEKQTLEIDSKEEVFKVARITCKNLTWNHNS